MARVSQPVQSPKLRSIWKGPLVAGRCFGLAYGVTQRLLSFNVAELIRFGPGFDVQVFPGTSLESLKLRFGDAEAEIRGNLDLQELERQPLEADGPTEPSAEPGAADAPLGGSDLPPIDLTEPLGEPPAQPKPPALSAPAPRAPSVPPPSAPAPQL